MSSKQSRNAEIVGIRRTTEPVYTGYTMTGTRIWTTVTARITSDGPDDGRLVHINLDPEQAMIYAQQMITAAGATHQMRTDVGHTD
ncbi:hypothetical protein ACFZAM_31900 [Streptomyces sp. NPDC008079]|uniref:hypothetical protein n=1 Tax=Streptomyces sp. NPDC008079 TaxID=3364806 RepID=UPI0036E18726